MARPEDRSALEQRAEAHSRELKRAIGDLRDAALAWADPRDPIRTHPIGWVAGGFAIGLWLGWRDSTSNQGW